MVTKRDRERKGYREGERKTNGQIVRYKGHPRGEVLGKF